MKPKGDTYLLRSVVAFEKRKGLDDFLAALQTVINRHDILRSAVYWQYLPQPVQVVHRQAPLCIEELALAGDDDALQQLLNHTDPHHLRLDLQQAPLLAAYIVADPHSDEWLLALLSHHIVCDHISLELIIAEIQMLLQGQGDNCSPPYPIATLLLKRVPSLPPNTRLIFVGSLATSANLPPPSNGSTSRVAGSRLSRLA